MMRKMIVPAVDANFQVSPEWFLSTCHCAVGNCCRNILIQHLRKRRISRSNRLRQDSGWSFEALEIKSGLCFSDLSTLSPLVVFARRRDSHFSRFFARVAQVRSGIQMDLSVGLLNYSVGIMTGTGSSISEKSRVKRSRITSGLEAPPPEKHSLSAQRKWSAGKHRRRPGARALICSGFFGLLPGQPVPTVLAENASQNADERPRGAGKPDDLVHLVTFGTHGVFRQTQDLIDHTFYHAGFRSHNRWFIENQPGVWNVPTESPEARKLPKIVFSVAGAGQSKFAGTPNATAHAENLQMDTSVVVREKLTSAETEHRWSDEKHALENSSSEQEGVNDDGICSRNEGPAGFEYHPDVCEGLELLPIRRVAPPAALQHTGVVYLRVEKKPRRDPGPAGMKKTPPRRRLAPLLPDRAEKITLTSDPGQPFYTRSLDLAKTSWWQENAAFFKKLQHDYRQIESYYLAPVYLGVRPLIMRETLQHYVPENGFLLLQDPNKYAGIEFSSDPNFAGVRNSSFFETMNANDLDTLKRASLEEGGDGFWSMFGTRTPVSVRREFMSTWFRSAFRVIYESFEHTLGAKKPESMVVASAGVGRLVAPGTTDVEGGRFGIRTNFSAFAYHERGADTAAMAVARQKLKASREDPLGEQTSPPEPKPQPKELLEGDFDLDLRKIYARIKRAGGVVKAFSILDADWLPQYQQVMKKFKRHGFRPDLDEMHLDFYMIMRELLKRQSEWKTIRRVLRQAVEGRLDEIIFDGKGVPEKMKLAPILVSRRQVVITPEDAFRSLCVEAELRAEPLRLEIRDMRRGQGFGESGSGAPASAQPAGAVKGDETEKQNKLMEGLLKEEAARLEALIYKPDFEELSKGRAAQPPGPQFAAPGDAPDSVSREQAQRKLLDVVHSAFRGPDASLLRAHRRCAEYWEADAPMIQDTWLFVRNTALTRKVLDLWVDFLKNRKMLLQMPFTDQTALGLLVRALDLKSACFPGMYDRQEPGHLQFGTCGKRTERVQGVVGYSAAATAGSGGAAARSVLDGTNVKTQLLSVQVQREGAPKEVVRENDAAGCPTPWWVGMRREEGLHGLGNRLKTVGKLVHEIRRTRKRLERRDRKLRESVGTGSEGAASTSATHGSTLHLHEEEPEDVREGGMYLLSWRELSKQDINSKTAGEWWMWN